MKKIEKSKENYNILFYAGLIFLLLVVISLGYMNTTYKEELQFQEAQINCYQYAEAHSTPYSINTNLKACGNTTLISQNKNDLLNLTKLK